MAHYASHAPYRPGNCLPNGTNSSHQSIDRGNHDFSDDFTGRKARASGKRLRNSLGSGISRLTDHIRRALATIP